MMENTFFNLRLWLHRFRNRYQKKVKKSLTIYEGLPDGVQRSILESICAEHFHRTIGSVSYTHLSGWKSSGAYRLVIKPTSGEDLFLIYKNAYYGDESIPALVDLPVIPGPPEYEIYRQSSGKLTGYLPQVYFAEEIVPGRHYHYILEDLLHEYRMMKGDGDKIHAGQLLPELHSVLGEWAGQAETSHLIAYGIDFSKALQIYALNNLEQFYRQAPDGNLKTVLAHWPDITRIHLHPDFFLAPLQLIHGDANYSNIHIHRQDPNRFKVVDLEWAGFGSPYADLAAMLKGSLVYVEKQAVNRFVHAESLKQPGMTGKDAFRYYLWSKLERCMLDAAFLSAQLLNSPTKSRINLESTISGAIHKMLMVYRQLS